MKKLLYLVFLLPFVAFAQQQDSGTASIHSTITPSDSTILYDTATNTPLCRAIFIEAAGDISITDRAGTTIVYTVPAGTLLPFRPYRVNATGTSPTTGIHCWRNNVLDPLR